MKKDLDLNQKLRQAKTLIKKNAKHFSFLAIIIVLLVYIFQVWQISSLSTAEPSPQDISVIPNNVPHIDQKAIDQVQSLEQSSSQVHALFNSARNNPF
jgi:predicted negative regulator of RcsB-dependent stress response